MDNNELKLIVEQIRCIALGKPIPENLLCESEELLEIQSGLEYISTNFLESNDFLKNLTDGYLNMDPPKNYSALSSNLKDLHSKLKHLTWQTSQISAGNYSQNISFLGEFSKSFNSMVDQLAQREEKLRKQSINLTKSIDLLKSVMDALEDSIVVTSVEALDVVYMNESARKTFLQENNSIPNPLGDCLFFNHLKSIKMDRDIDSTFNEFLCEETSTSFYVNTFSIYWNDELSYVHYVKDATNEKEYKTKMENMANKDPLTDIYNRRFCINTMQSLLKENKSFVCCLMDIDGLKLANDNFGHKSGDDYIKTVVHQIITIFDIDDDYLCRLGGDEFIIISPNRSYAEVIELSNMVDSSLIALSKEHPMSISFGAILIESGEKITVNDILEKADNKMYKYKKNRKKERES